MSGFLDKQRVVTVGIPVPGNSRRGAGADPGDFGQTNTCGASVAAKAHCTISVKFTPTAIGARTGTLTVNTAAVEGPQTVSLTGTGK